MQRERETGTARDWLGFQRIGILTDTFDEINGVTNTYRELVRYCRETGVKLDLFCPSAEEDSDEELHTVTIHRIKQTVGVPVYSDLSFDLKIISPRIGMYFVKNRFDLIHASSPGNMGLQALTLSYYHRLPLVGVYHTALPEYAEDRALQIGKRLIPALKKTGFWENLTWHFVSWFYNQCDLVLAPSAHVRGILEERLKAEVRIFSRGIDLDRFNPRRRGDPRGEGGRPESGGGKPGGASPRVTVLYVGRVSIEKGLDDLLYSVAGMRGVRLVVVGDGPYRRELEERAGEGVVFSGFLTGDELGAAYASADFFVFPSKTDTFGNVVLEAMASGLPVIVTDRMAPKELVENGGNGFIVRDRDEMREKVALLAGDAALRRRMGESSRRLAERRTWPQVLERLFEDYFWVKMHYDYARKCKLFEPFNR